MANMPAFQASDASSILAARTNARVALHQCGFYFCSVILKHMQRGLMKQIISVEYLVAAALVMLFYIVVGNFAWYWLFILFLVFDSSALGYLVNNRVGALGYNIGHSLIGPTLLVGLYVATDNQAILFISLLWLFHIFIDRTLGYGLKHTTSFQHTHLGHIGKKQQL